MTSTIDRIRRDHERILEFLDEIEALADAPGSAEVGKLADRLTEMREALRVHEGFEEDYFARANADSPTLVHEIDRIREENAELREQAAAFGRWLDAARNASGLAVTEALQARAREVVRLVRDHIHRENVGLFFLAGESIREDAP